MSFVFKQGQYFSWMFFLNNIYQTWKRREGGLVVNLQMPPCLPNTLVEDSKNKLSDKYVEQKPKYSHQIC